MRKLQCQFIFIVLCFSTLTASAQEQVADASTDKSAEQKKTWERRFELQNTVSGASGGIHIVDARTMAPGSFRLQLGGEYFYATSFLSADDHHRHVGGELSLSIGILNFLEAYGTLSTSSNYNRSESPTVIQSLGDASLGLKLGGAISRAFALGGDARVLMLKSIGDLGTSWKSTSAAFRVSATGDLRGMKKSKPIIMRFSLEYFLDNSAQLISTTEQNRYNALPDPATNYADEDRNLVSRVERYGLGVNRVDQLRIGAGLEVPIRTSETFSINPIAEWNLGIPVNRQGYNCLYTPSANDPTQPPAGSDGCLNEQGFAAYPQTLTFGARVLPPLRGLSVFAGVDIGITGVNTTVRELAPTAPYMVRFGISYAYDVRPHHEASEPKVVVAAPKLVAAPKGVRIRGKVLDSQNQIPVPHVVVRFVGMEKTSLYVGDLGDFITDELPPGPVKLELLHPRYEPGQCDTVIPQKGGDVTLVCRLNPLPTSGRVEGKVSDSTGAEVGPVEVNMEGQRLYRATVDREGRFVFTDVVPGTYTIKLASEKYYSQSVPVQVEAQKIATPAVVLNPKPKTASVVVSGKEIVLKKRIHFANDSAEIAEDSRPLIAEIADVLQQNKNIEKVEIQGHTDNRGAAAHNRKVSQDRADAVKQALVQAGVDSARLTAKGYGPDRPLVPNITSRNRARNRRVQMIILEQ